MLTWVCLWMGTTALHRTAKNGSDNLPVYPPNNHHCTMSKNAYARDAMWAEAESTNNTNLDKHVFTTMFLKPSCHGKWCGNCRRRTRLETAGGLDHACQRWQHSGTQLGILNLECQRMCWSRSSLDAQHIQHVILLSQDWLQRQCTKSNVAQLWLKSGAILSGRHKKMPSTAASIVKMKKHTTSISLLCSLFVHSTSLHCCVSYTGCQSRDEWSSRSRVLYTSR